MESQNNLGLEEIERLQKRGIRLAESYGSGSVFNTERPLEGITQKQRVRTSKAADVMNIGSGTRCKACGMLYFCWVDKCRTCNQKMDFNLGTHDESGA